MFKFLKVVYTRTSYWSIVFVVIGNTTMLTMSWVADILLKIIYSLFEQRHAKLSKFTKLVLTTDYLKLLIYIIFYGKNLRKDSNHVDSLWKIRLSSLCDKLNYFCRYTGYTIDLFGNILKLSRNNLHYLRLLTTSYSMFGIDSMNVDNECSIFTFLDV